MGVLAVKFIKKWLFAAALFFVFLFFVMVGAKVSLAKKGVNKPCIVCSKIPNVTFGNNTKKEDVEVYFVDKKGLKNAVKNFGDVLKNKVDFEKFEAKSGQKAALGYINDEGINQNQEQGYFWTAIYECSLGFTSSEINPMSNELFDMMALPIQPILE